MPRCWQWLHVGRVRPACAPLSLAAALCLLAAAAALPQASAIRVRSRVSVDSAARSHVHSRSASTHRSDLRSAPHLSLSHLSLSALPAGDSHTPRRARTGDAGFGRAFVATATAASALLGRTPPAPPPYDRHPGAVSLIQTASHAHAHAHANADTDADTNADTDADTDADADAEDSAEASGASESRTDSYSRDSVEDFTDEAQATRTPIDMAYYLKYIPYARSSLSLPLPLSLCLSLSLSPSLSLSLSLSLSVVYDCEVSSYKAGLWVWR